MNEIVNEDTKLSIVVINNLDISVEYFAQRLELQSIKFDWLKVRF